PHRIDVGSEAVTDIQMLDQIHFKSLRPLDRLALYPAKHFVTPPEKLEAALGSIRQELEQRVKELIREGKDLEAKRLESRTRYDLEMLREVGHCGGVENYSRHLTGRAPGSTPYTLLDYFPKDYITIIDESHQTLPQVRGMFNGDFSRKKVLVDHGFRLPSALDNRPLKFDEFERKTGQVLYVSATPAAYEMARTSIHVEQIIRPTGLLDPEIDVRPSEGQVDDLIAEIKARAKKNERVLVTTLTKKMAEDLSRYLRDVGIKVNYLHSEFDAFERMEILRDLRLQKYDCVIGVNLLREGLDLPEVSLMAILDADKEGFLRNDVSLLQTAGRAARHVHGRVIMYADRITDSMRRAMDETCRRRKLQMAYNVKHEIKPESIKKEIREGIEKYQAAEALVAEVAGEDQKAYETKTYLAFLKSRMEAAARALDFPKAARYRDEIRRLEAQAPDSATATEKPSPRPTVQSRRPRLSRKPLKKKD
ncbi:MAG: UvrB/UvrC motif-containing protein, partial [Candidatus Omnitrophica bacterium]|nr:UvrB/UvrC motif-containing protein [Candidatus Omnitrophota bacterium]